MASLPHSSHLNAVRPRVSYPERHPTATAIASVVVLVLVGLVTGELVGRLAVLLVEAALSVIGGSA